MSKHRAEVRPRYGRIGVALVAASCTVVAVLGGTGLLPSAADQVPRAVDDGQSETRAATTAEPEADESTDDGAAKERQKTRSSITLERDLSTDTSLPAAAGEGRRVVFSESRQRVWLVQDGGEVQSTYLVSGSVYDNLEPGTFEVFSRSEDAVGIDDSGTMKYFVRFTRGPSGAAIGFHDIPVDDGDLVQTDAELGTPLSHGCIRQKRDDAIELWDFAPLGTTVVVTA